MEKEEFPQIKVNKEGEDTQSVTEEQAQTQASEEAQDDKEAQSQGRESVLIPKIAVEEGKEKPKMIEKNKKEKIRFPSDKRKKVLRILIGLGIFLALFILFFVIPSFNVYRKTGAFITSANNLITAGKEQDLAKIRGEIENTRDSLAGLKSSFRLISWTKFIPFLGAYPRDFEHALNAGSYGLDAAEIVVETIEPYADIIGFTGAQTLAAADGEKTAEERIDFVVQTIPELIPKIDDISAKAEAVKEEVDQIDAERYPVKLGKLEVREKMRRGIFLVDEAALLLKNGKPLLESAPYLLGMDGRKTYLVLFQNDKELRPTGGFMTAYSVMEVEDAKFTPVASNDIYNLDTRYRPSEPAPEPVVTYLKGPYILSKNVRLRDMNWSPDFAEAMELFTEEAEKAGIDQIDGIIAVDTQVLVYLLEVLGPIGVPGFGNYSTKIVPECNCPQVIYELESFADVEGPIVWDPISGEIVYSPPHSDNRKEIIGPLMNSILANALGQPKDKLPDLFEAAFDSLREKHVMFYLFDDKAQSAVESFGIAGRIVDYQGDYLHINDANLGGRKSNLYVTQEVDQQIEIAGDGKVTKTLTITYKNPEKHDGWLNSVLPNWVRIYVPKGSELVDVTGMEDKKEPYEEFGKTVFAGFFELRPEGIAKVTVTYKLPFNSVDNEDFKLFIQKQPGKDAPLYTINLGKNSDEFFLKTDKELRISI